MKNEVNFSMQTKANQTNRVCCVSFYLFKHQKSKLLSLDPLSSMGKLFSHTPLKHRIDVQR